MVSASAKFSIAGLHVHYGKLCVLRDLNLDIQANEIFTVIGPANSGKTTFLHSLNRLVDLVPGSRLSGEIRLDGVNIRAGIEVEALRRKVGIVFALPLPLPISIFENVVYGLRMQGIRDARALTNIRRYIRENPAHWGALDAQKMARPVLVGNPALLDLPMTAFLASRMARAKKFSPLRSGGAG